MECLPLKFVSFYCGWTEVAKAWETRKLSATLIGSCQVHGHHNLGILLFIMTPWLLCLPGFATIKLLLLHASPNTLVCSVSKSCSFKVQAFNFAKQLSFLFFFFLSLSPLSCPPSFFIFVCFGFFEAGFHSLALAGLAIAM